MKTIPIRQPSVKVKLIILLFSVALIVCNVLRMLHVPMTHDEIGAVSQLPSYHDIFTLHPVTANNHILNSIIRKFLVETFHNTSPFMIRLDNLLALVLFLYSLYLLLRRLFDKPFWIVAGFLFVVLNPFLFEFWGLSRGYGLSIAFMTASIYSLVVYLQDNKQSQLWLCQFWAVLAVYSSFVLLNFYVSLAGITVLLPLLFNKENGIKQALKSLPALAVSAIIIYLLVAAPIQALRSHNELYYGGNLGLVSDTLKSLTNDSFMINYESSFIKWLNRLIRGIIMLSVVYWVVQYFREKDDKIKTGVAFMLLLIMPLAAISLQHHLLQVKYLIDRTALFLVILFKLQLLYTVYHLSQKKPRIAQAALLFMTCFAIVNFARLINISRSWSWWSDANNIVVLNRMIDQQKNKPGKIKIRTDWIFAPPFIYYTDTKYRDAFYPVMYIHTPVTNDTSYNYYYIRGDESGVLQENYTCDTAFFNGMYVLMKRKW